MKDKSFLDKKNLEAIRNEKKSISENSWERINKHFEDKKPKGKIFLLNNYMKVAAGIMLLMSFTWMIYNNTVSVTEINSVVSEEQPKHNISNPTFEKSSQNKEKEERRVEESEEAVENKSNYSIVNNEIKISDKTPSNIINHVPKTEIEDFKAKETIENVAISIEKANKNKIDQDYADLTNERQIVDLAAIETQIPQVYSETFKKVNLEQYHKQTEISDSYFDGTSTGALVGQILLDLISDNTIVSDLNNKFQKFKNLEVIQINW